MGGLGTVLTILLGAIELGGYVLIWVMIAKL